MEDKLVVLDSLKSNEESKQVNIRNVSSECEQKCSKQHSKSETFNKGPQSKIKNILEFSRASVKFFNLLKNLNAGKQGSSNSAKSNKREDISFKEKYKKMNTKDPDILNEVSCCKTKASHSTESKYCDGGAYHNPSSSYSSNGTIINESCKEKTDRLNNEATIEKHHEESQPILNFVQSEPGDLINCEEAFNQSENNITKNEVLAISSNNGNISATVQDWIDNLPLENSSKPLGIENRNYKNDVPDIKNSRAADECSTSPAKLSREASLQSSSSLDSLLDSRKPDPVEIFLNLGFGGVPGVDMEICRIPKRFLVPSQCKGGDWNEFLRRELIQAQNFECSSLGFRGLSGPSYRRPSAIVANIMEKLRERAISQPYCHRTKIGCGKKHSNEKRTDNKLSPEFQSVLSPDSRKFLQNQGKISPEVPRRRIIFGQKSFAFGRDGEFVEIESSAKNVAESPNDVSSDPIMDSQNGIQGEDNAEKIRTDSLRKYRRGSLQKQAQVEDEDFEPSPEPDSPYYIVGNGKNKPDFASGETETSLSASKSLRKGSGKIPRRFFSSSNLKSLECDANLSDIMRREVEKEIRSLSQKIKGISDQELISVLKQVKELSSALESTSHVSYEP